jgi:uncharacterized protein
MQILVDRLTSTPTPFVFELGSGWWREHMNPERGLPREVVRPLEVRVEAHEMGEDLYLEGGVSGEIELECSRCLARYRHPLREPFRLVLEPAGSRVPADPEARDTLARDGLCLLDEFEMGWYRGREIRLDSVALEVISLALPVKPLCREDCAGLCSRCGADQNQGPCGCAEINHKSPFAVLAALRGGDTGGAR